MSESKAIRLSKEQQEVVQLVLDGKNVLVDACIGSGKTTTIQKLCSKVKGKKILYLTYNKCLKAEAKSKINQKNVEVNNYHGFAWKCLNDMGIRVAVNQLIKTFIQKNVNIHGYDLLLVDEYQDINEEISHLLEKIKRCNPDMQIVMVGDMKQKIYDWTTLDVEKFVDNFLGEYEKKTFSICFRINAEWAERLGNIWEKKITGVNTNCDIEVIENSYGSFDIDRVVDIISQYDPSQLLCLGSRGSKFHTTAMTETLNMLEEEYPEKFNKNTVYATITEKGDGVANPDSKCAIFTTFDSSKGLEREVCFVFDWDMSYWKVRLDRPDTRPEIIRNIFCVGASRGKRKIYLVETRSPINIEELQDCIKRDCEKNEINHDYKDTFSPSNMFDFKYNEDVDKCYSLLNVSLLESGNGSNIEVRNSDGLIDISIVWGHYQEQLFFKTYDKEKMVNYLNYLNAKNKSERISLTDEEKENNSSASWLFSKHMARVDTQQDRYIKQVKVKPKKKEEQAITERLEKFFDHDDTVQKEYYADFFVKSKNPEKETEKIHIAGLADVVKNDMINELKFVSEVSPVHFLQLAMYLIMSETEKGMLYNTKNDELFEVTITDRTAFRNAVVKTITKGYYSKVIDYECGEGLNGED